MNYAINLMDARKRLSAMLNVTESTVRKRSIDVVFDVLGAPADELVRANILAAGQVDDFNTLQQMIFDRDADGLFIRETVHFKANGREIDPDLPISNAFVASERDGMRYMRCDLVLEGGSEPIDQFRAAGDSHLQSQSKGGGGAQGGQSGEANDPVKDYSKIFFLHQVAAGRPIDVTKDHPELQDTIAQAEREGLLEIDVKKAAYALSEKGKREHDSYIAEAQDLIKRFDIYGDVDVDSNGSIHFDTGLGKDYRVPAFEHEGVDPFRARFLLGLNDGEWDKLDNWENLYTDSNWYASIFAPVERAPSVEQIGNERLDRIISQAKQVLRKEQEHLSS